MGFWLLLSLASLLSCGLVYLLLSRSAQSNDESERTARIKRNVQLFLQKQKSLKAELADEFIDQSTFDELDAELSRQLLNDVSSIEKSRTASTFPFVAKAFLSIVPLMALVLYYYWGAYPDVLIKERLDELQQSSSMEEYTQRLDSLAGAIEERLKIKPEHIDYRVLLATYAMNKRDYESAAFHYGILAELLPDDSEALAFYAQAEYLQNGGQFSPIVLEFMQKTLDLNPHNQTALGMKGIYEMTQGNYPGAVKAWKLLLTTLEPGSPDAQVIAEAIVEAESKMGIAQAEASKGEGLWVTVALAESLADLNPDLAVFVYIKAQGGPPMPLAAKKLKVSDLPVKIFLDESSAMTPQMTIMQFETVKVGARVSYSGTAIAESGDWFGEQSELEWKQLDQVDIVISQKID